MPGNGFMYSNLVLTAPAFHDAAGANGLAADGHFVTSAIPGPEPGRWAQVPSGLGCLAVLARRRRAA